MLQSVTYSADQSSQIHRLGLNHRPAAEIEHLLHQFGRLFCLIDDGIQVSLKRWRVFGLTLGHMGVEKDGAQQVAKVVGDAGCQLADGCEGMLCPF